MHNHMHIRIWSDHCIVISGTFFVQELLQGKNTLFGGKAVYCFAACLRQVWLQAQKFVCSLLMQTLQELFQVEEEEADWELWIEDESL